jgi:hypothetical protein
MVLILLLHSLCKRAPKIREGKASMIVDALDPFSDDQVRPGIRALDR